MPPEMQYAVALVADRWYRLKQASDWSGGDRPGDGGFQTLELIVLAAALVVAAAAAGIFLVGKIDNYKSKIK